MKFNKKHLPIGDALIKEAEELGVSQHGLCTEKLGNINEAILQQRVIDARRSRREHRLWIVAVISAILAALSAIAAWWAVFTQCS